MIESGALPEVHAVASFAGCRQLGRHVIERRCPLVVLKMAGHAFRAEARVDTGRRAEMALVAGSRGMGAQQGKAVVMLLDRRDGYIPAANRMTLLAVGAELTPVQIGVALPAAGGRSRKHQAYMAALAGHVLVQALQRKTGLPVVVELQFPPHRFPCSRRVAVFAGNFQLAVRTRRTGRQFLRAGRQNTECGNRKDQQQ